jgi:hypothetical protein
MSDPVRNRYVIVTICFVLSVMGFQVVNTIKGKKFSQTLPVLVTEASTQ